MTNHIQAWPYTFKLHFQAGGRVSQSWGVTLRGGFGAALRAVSCSQSRGDCRDCILAGRCPYGYVFETPVQPGAAVMRKYTHAPHPFVFGLPDTLPQAVDAGASVEIGLTLIGRGNDYFPYFVLALQELGQRGLGRDQVRFDVVSADCAADSDGAEPALRGGKCAACRGVSVPIRVGDAEVSRVAVEFASPVLVRHQGRPAREISFALLISNILRRADLLSAFHGDGQLSLDAPALVRSAREVATADDRTHWSSRDRFSRRQNRTMPLEGLQGRLAFAGPIGPFLPILQAGERIHVGRNTSFGLGKIRILDIST